MFDVVLLPLIGMNNFSLIAIATPGDETNHYSQLMDRVDDRGRPLFFTIRIALACSECMQKGVEDVCEHRADLIPPWKSRARMDKIRKACLCLSISLSLFLCLFLSLSVFLSLSWWWLLCLIVCVRVCIRYWKATKS